MQKIFQSNTVSPKLQKQQSVSASPTVNNKGTTSGAKCVYIVAAMNSVDVFQHLYLLVQAIKMQAGFPPEQFADEIKSAPISASSAPSGLTGLPANLVCKKIQLKAQKFELQYIFLSETDFLHWVKEKKQKNFEVLSQYVPPQPLLYFSNTYYPSLASLIERQFKHTLHLQLLDDKIAQKLAIDNIIENSSKNSKFAYFQIHPKNEPSKKSIILIELFAKQCPKIIENFLSICEGNQENELGEKLSYVQQVSKCVLKLANDSSFLQSTLCTTLRGSQTISGFVLEDEGFTLKHDVPGLLGAVRKSQARHNNTSDFYITLKKLASFDGKSVIFGRICLGFKDLKRCVKIAPQIDITRAGQVELMHEHFSSMSMNSSTVFTLENLPDKRMLYLETDYLKEYEKIEELLANIEENDPPTVKRKVKQLKQLITGLQEAKSNVPASETFNSLLQKSINLLLSYLYSQYQKGQMKKDETELLKTLDECQEYLKILSTYEDKRMFAKWSQVIVPRQQLEKHLTLRSQQSQKFPSIIADNSKNDKQQQLQPFKVGISLSEEEKNNRSAVAAHHQNVNSSSQNSNTAVASHEREAVQLEQKMQDFGQGGFGSVEEVVDLNSLEIYAVKSFKSQNTADSKYVQEKEAYLKLQSVVTEELLQQYAITLKKFDDQRHLMYFQPAQCSLEHLLKEKLRLEQRFTSNDIKYIFVMATKFVLLLKSKDCVHNDIKTENLVLVAATNDSSMSKNRKELRFIDLGESNNKDQSEGFTPKFFFNPLRKYVKPDWSHAYIPVFRNRDEKYRNEMFCVMRLMQDILITQPLDQEVKVHRSISAENLPPSIEEFLLIQRRIEQVYYADLIEEDEQLQKIMQFISEKGLRETYTWEELQALVNSIEYEGYILDQDQITEKHVKKKRQELESKFNVLDQLFGIRSYIPLQGSKSYTYNNQFDLMDKMVEFCLPNAGAENTKVEQQVLLLMGNSGAGKSLFLLQLARTLNTKIKEDHKKFQQQGQGQKPAQLHIEFLKLNEYNRAIMDNDPQARLLNMTIEEKIEEVLQKAASADEVLFMLDGFDEFGSKEKFAQDIFKLQERPHVKIIITSRIYYLSKQDIEFCFSFKNKRENNQEQLKALQYYICPFDDRQRSEFVSKLIDSAQKLEAIHIEFPHFESVEEYTVQFKQNPVLKELASTPFTLRLTCTILPELQSSGSYQQNSITKFRIYQAFTKKWYNKEVLRAASDYFQVLEEFWGIEVKDGDLDNEEYLNNTLYKDLDQFNVKLCWLLLSDSRIVFDAQYINDFVAIYSNQKKENQIKDIQKFNSNKARIDLLLRCSPVVKNVGNNNYQYIHKSFYEYYLALGVLLDHKTFQDQDYIYLQGEINYDIKNRKIDLNIFTALLSPEPEALRMIAESGVVEKIEQYTQHIEDSQLEFEHIVTAKINLRAMSLFVNEKYVQQKKSLRKYFNEELQKFPFSDNEEGFQNLFDIANEMDVCLFKQIYTDQELYLQNLDKIFLLRQLKYHNNIFIMGETFFWFTHDKSEQAEEDQLEWQTFQSCVRHQSTANSKYLMAMISPPYSQTLEQLIAESGSAGIAHAELKEMFIQCVQGLRHLKNNKLFNLAITPKSILKYGTLYRVSEYWNFHDSQINKSYLIPNARHLQNYLLEDLFRKQDPEKMSVFSLGLTFLQSILGVSSDRFIQLTRGGDYKQLEESIKDLEFKKLIKNMLNPNERERWSFEQILLYFTDQIDDKERERQNSFYSLFQFVQQLLKNYKFKNLQMVKSQQIVFHLKWDNTLELVQQTVLDGGKYQSEDDQYPIEDYIEIKTKQPHLRNKVN